MFSLLFSTCEPNFCSKVEKKVHVGATTFCIGSKFQFDNPEEIFDIQNCIKILNIVYLAKNNNNIDSKWPP